MKHSTFSRFRLLFALLAFPFVSSAQDLSTALGKFGEQYVQERFFVSTDKEIYKPEDSLKFQVFKFSTALQQPASEVLYIDLIDEKGKVLEHKIFRLEGNNVQASWKLADDASGFLRLRAYTRTSIQHGANATEIQFFVHSGKRSSGQALAALNRKDAPVTLHFYPEGGSLPAGFMNKVVIHATDEQGWPHQVSGDIVDSHGKKVTEFTTNNNGYAIVNFEALDNVYQAHWKNGLQDQKQPLPTILKDGAGLECRNDEKGITYMVKRTEPYTGSGSYQLIAHQLYSPVYLAKLNLKATDIASGFIDTKDLAPGVIYIALLDASNKVVASRLVYHNASAMIAPINTIEANVKYENGSPAVDLKFAEQQHSGFLLQARSIKSRNGATGFVIPTGFLFGNEISCPVPSVLLQKNEAAGLQEELNTLLLMSNWNGPAPAEILASTKATASLKPETGLGYKGHFTHGFKKEMGGTDMVLMAKMRNGLQQFFNIKPDENGEFELNNVAFEDTALAQYRIQSTKKSTATRRMTLIITPTTLEKSPVQAKAIRLDPNRFANLIATGTLSGNDLARRMDSLATSADGTLLGGVTVKSVTRTPLQVLNDEYSHGFFNGMENARVITPEKDPAFLSSMSVFHYLEGRVAGLEVNPSATLDPVKWRGHVTSLFLNEIPQQMPEGSQLAEDASAIQSIPMSDVALIKIFSPPFVLAMGNGPGGAIAVYTKKGSDFQRRQLSETISLPGFSTTGATQELYYTLGEKQALRLLNWMPGLHLDNTVSNRVVRIVPQTGSRSDHVLIQGFDAKGRIVLKEIAW